MSLFLNQIRRFKFSFSVYNFFNQRKLAHNKENYRKFKINQPLFYSISSKDFIHKEKGEQPWLDREVNLGLFEEKLSTSNFSDETKTKLRDWKENGYLILNSFLNQSICNLINEEIDQLIQNEKINFNSSGKIMFANKKSNYIDSITRNRELIEILEFILGDKVIPFQTINFIKGSEQDAHSDSIHMTTHPLGYLIAAWIALEDISENQGPLSYYPGSHKLPYLLNDGYERGGNRFTVGAEENYKNYEKKISESIRENNFLKKKFIAKKGDILIWHANLIHGGEPIVDKNSSRKSMVIHYFAENVIKYHEINERPALL